MPYFVMEVGPTFVYPRALCHVDDWALYLACLAATRHGESYFVILRGGVSHQKAGGSETGAGARQIDLSCTGNQQRPVWVQGEKVQALPLQPTSAPNNQRIGK